MNFTEIAETRQSCRSYDPCRRVEEEKLDRILATARLSPSACNGQPYLITVCRGDAAKKVAKATQGMGINKFAPDAPIMLVISEMPYVSTAALGAKVITAPSTSALWRHISPQKLPLKGLAPASSDGLTTPRSVKFAALMVLCVLLSPSAIPRTATSSARKSVSRWMSLLNLRSNT